MTASIFGLKRAQARFNASRCISVNAASIAALNDATFGCLDLFVILSTIRRSPKDSNLGCWEARILSTKTCRRCPTTNFAPNDLCGRAHRPAGKHMAFQTTQFPSTASLHSTERATIALDHPKSALEPFQ